ncbi:MAG: hypothetical protein KAW12_10955, partial [Candidatus Aminicenantes bacterium]|nr:hypothetical protein [Candidatus Aminicenantes bacterium]
MIDQNKQKAVEIYWLNKLSGTLPKISLPRYGEEKGGKPGKEQLRFEIAKPVLSKLLEIGNNSHLAVFILLLSALKITLHKYTGLDDILVGTLSPKKEGVKSSLIFCRTRIDKDLTLKETINRIKEDVMQDFDYVDYSFGTLYQKLAANRDMDSLEIFNAAFIYDKLQEKSKLLNQYNLVFTFSTEEEQPSL